ncbi:flavin reductase family protein [bacterium]|nr:flavin reductase family protein [bacterium]MDB4505003.1 flavin reductase family protein [Akkermansiaceae bacterium]MDB4568288.1 flavin reductase family protein [Akkermansiaceae bacterium]
MVLTTADYQALDKLARVQLATSLPGPKPICLVSTRGLDGRSNLAPFSSITHLGSSPLLIGMVTRPATVDRHTLQNILDTKSWTLNQVTESTYEKAHQCAARYPGDVSEFEATGLSELSHDGVTAPFIKECPIRYALELEDVIDIPVNKTKLIVGRVVLIDLPDGALSPDGTLDLPAQGSIASTALDTYYSISSLGRLPYAKP